MPRGTGYDKSWQMNAVDDFALALERCRILVALGARQRMGSDLGATSEVLRARLVTRYRASLADFLNRLQRADLEAVCHKQRIEATGTVGELRARLWMLGAHREAGGAEHLGQPYQPLPIVLGSQLRFQGALHGECPPASDWPRAVPSVIEEPCAPSEPDSLEELLDNANRLLGCRLGERGSDKGIYGTRIAALLGVRERGFAEADWRGEIEIKSVPVVRDRAGWWRVKEDPAISMEAVDPRIKLRRVLWIVRVGADASSPILSWYYQEWDAKIAALATRYLHQRPKGPRGTNNKGWYLQKRFFLYSGFLKSLNG